MKFPPWSYSSLSSFETCPRRYYHIKIAKDVTEQVHEATTWGKTVHKHIENRLKDGTPLPEYIAKYEPLVFQLANTKGELLIEQQLAVTCDMKPAGWTDSNAWCRGIIDVGVHTGKRAILCDWKTGKRKPDLDQLKLFAGLCFANYPDLEAVSTGFVWLKANTIDRQSFTRDDVAAIWQHFVPRVMRMERAYDEGTFPPRPSGLCASYCPVPKRQCQHSGTT